MAADDWLVRLTNWITFHLSLGEDVQEIEDKFRDAFGGLTQEQFEAGIESALTAKEVDERLRDLSVDQPLSDALGPNAPPEALVYVRARAEFECPFGATSNREVASEYPWSMSYGEVFNDLVDLAFMLLGTSDLANCTLLGIEIREPTYFAR